MGTSLVRQTDFSAGEVDPRMHHMADAPAVRRGLAECLNLVPTRFGALQKRGGLEWRAASAGEADKRCRLVPFREDADASYILEFYEVAGAGKVRVLDHDGAVVQYADAGFNLHDVVLDTPWTEADLAKLQWAQRNGDLWLATGTTRAYRVSNTAPYGTGGLGGWKVAPVEPDAAMFSKPDKAYLRVAGIGDSVEYPAKDWFIGVTNWVEGRHPVTGEVSIWESPLSDLHEESLAIYPDANRNVVYGYDRAASGDTHEVAGYIRSGIRIYRGLKPYEMGLALEVESAGGWSDNLDPADDFAAYWGRTTDYGYPPDLTRPPPASFDPQEKPDNPAVDLHPAAPSFIQQRSILAGGGLGPQSLWFSDAGNLTRWSTGTPVHPTDGFEAVFDADLRQNVVALAVLRDLMVFTDAGVWAVGASGAPIVPGGTAAMLFARHGAAPLPLAVIGNSVVFVTSRSGTVRDLRYNFQVGGYAGDDLMTFAAHLLEGRQVVDVAVHQVPHPLVWLLLDDGSLVSLTYAPEQGIVGWARHETAGEIQSIAALQVGSADTLVAAVVRDGVRSIERLTLEKPREASDGVFLDAAVRLDVRDYAPADTFVVELPGTSTGKPGDAVRLYPTGAFGFDPVVHEGATMAVRHPDGDFRVVLDGSIASGLANGHLLDTYPGEDQDQAPGWFAASALSGLDHLEGQDVTLTIDGAPAGTATVAGGTVPLPQPAVVAAAGVPFAARATVLPVAKPDPTIQVAVPSASLEVQGAAGLQVGGKDAVLPIPTRYNALPTLDTEVIDVSQSQLWGESGRVRVEQTAPTPFTLLSLTRRVAHR